MPSEASKFDVFVKSADGVWVMVAAGLCLCRAGDLAQESKDMGLAVSVLPGGWRHASLDGVDC